MARTATAQAVQASTSNSAAGTTTSSSFPINYGVSGIATIINGGTGPTVACDFVILVSNDNSTFIELYRQTAGIAASTTYRFPFSFGPSGRGGDWLYYKVQFTGNTAQAVTVQADACTTTGY